MTIMIVNKLTENHLISYHYCLHLLIIRACTFIICKLYIKDLDSIVLSQAKRLLDLSAACNWVYKYDTYL